MTQYSSSGFPRTRQDKETHTDKKKSSALVVFDMERAPRWLNWVGEILSFWPWTNGLVEPARTCQARELINVTSQWHTCQGGTRTDNIINFVYLISAYSNLFTPKECYWISWNQSTFYQPNYWISQLIPAWLPVRVCAHLIRTLIGRLTLVARRTCSSPSAANAPPPASLRAQFVIVMVVP